MQTLTNPANGYELTIHSPVHIGAMMLLFGPLYLAAKGVWGHAALMVVIVIMTGGLAWLVYPFIGRRLIMDHYRKQGWITPRA